MHDSFAVRRIQRVADLTGVFQRFLQGQRTFDRLTLDIFHHYVVRADVVQRADVRVIQRGDSACLALESFGELLQAHLDGHDPVEPGITRLIYFPIPPAPMRPRISYGPS